MRFLKTGRRGLPRDGSVSSAHTGLTLAEQTPQARHSNLGPVRRGLDHSVSACPGPDPRSPVLQIDLVIGHKQPLQGGGQTSIADPMLSLMTQ